MHQNPSHGFAGVQNVIAAHHRDTENKEELLLIVMTDRKEYIHLINTSRHYDTINKTPDKSGLGAIKSRQRPNRSPTIKYPMHTFSQPYIHTSNCPPIRHLTTTSYHPSQEYILTLHNNKQNSDKIGLRAIKPRQRPNRSPANYLLNHQVSLLTLNRS